MALVSHLYMYSLYIHLETVSDMFVVGSQDGGENSRRQHSLNHSLAFSSGTR